MTKWPVQKLTHRTTQNTYIFQSCIMFWKYFLNQSNKLFNTSDKDSKIAFDRILLVFDMIFPF